MEVPVSIDRVRGATGAALLLGALACFAAPAAAQTVNQVGVAAPAGPQIGALPASGAGGYLSNFYQIDDGSTESSIGLVLGGTLCWLQTFDTRPNAEYDVIDQVQVAYGFPQNPGFAVPNGTPASVCVWEDPTDDGDPSDALLLSLQATTVQNVDTQALNGVAIPPVTVRGKFFVGVFLKHLANQFPASRDLNTLSQGRAFFVGTTTLNGVFDPANLAGLGHTQIFSLDTAGSPPGSLNSVWRVRAVGQGPTVMIYCAGKLNSLGCAPQIGSSGIPQATAFNGFVVSDTNVRNQKVGLLLYSTGGPAAQPFQGGLLCVGGAIKRGVARGSGGSATPASDCSGRFELDMNAFAHGLYGGSPLAALQVVGTQINCQWWGRDPGFPAPNNSSLSQGLQYSVLP